MAASSTSAIRANGLNLVVAAIVQWNTVYLQRPVQTLADGGQTIDEALMRHLRLLEARQREPDDSRVSAPR